VTRYNVHLPDPQIDALRRIAEEKGMTVAELIRRAIDEWLAKNAKTGKE
jgi:predicted DNA-binding ribbon-helix-helix protein